MSEKEWCDRVTSPIGRLFCKSFIAKTLIWYKEKTLIEGLKHSLETGSGLTFFISIILGLSLAAFVLVKQYYGTLVFSIPVSAVEIYLSAVGMFVIVNQTHIWGMKKTEKRVFRKGEFVLLMWTVIVISSWTMHFFWEKPYQEELTKIVIGVFALYAVSKISTVLNHHRHNGNTK